MILQGLENEFDKLRTMADAMGRMKVGYTITPVDFDAVATGMVLMLNDFMAVKDKMQLAVDTNDMTLVSEILSAINMGIDMINKEIPPIGTH